MYTPRRQPTASTSKRTLSATPSLCSSPGSSISGDTEIADNEGEYIPHSLSPWLYQRFPIRAYLANSGFPLFKHLGKPSLLALKDLQFALDWPTYRLLTRKLADPSSLRTLKKVIRFGTRQELATAVNRELAQFSEDRMALKPPIEGEHMLSMNLPCDGVVDFNEEDKQFLAALQNEDDMFRIYKGYVLDTVTAATRLMRRYPPGIKCLDFKITNRFCPDHRTKWDIFTLPKIDNNDEQVALAVIFVPPWEFGSGDFRQFVAEKTFMNNSLDLLDRRLKEHVASDVMWAVTYDTLYQRGTRFVVSNYVNWAFGSFNYDWTEARVTEVYEANLTDLEGNMNWAPHKGATVLELLCYWTYICADKPVGY
ncbi:hypothetical protein BDZ97DRAFT_1760608 [Flammula alnicola]|nr:hypothetical protein BDZ97DRAFT_1760608 [Flammula alnicola]